MDEAELLLEVESEALVEDVDEVELEELASCSAVSRVWRSELSLEIPALGGGGGGGPPGGGPPGGGPPGGGPPELDAELALVLDADPDVWEAAAMRSRRSCQAEPPPDEPSMALMDMVTRLSAARPRDVDGRVTGAAQPRLVMRPAG